MRIRAGAWDGAQPRTHVLAVLRSHGVEINPQRGDFYELVDLDGDPILQHIPNPVPPEVVAFLYRRFGDLHGFEITDLRKPKH